MNNNNTRVKTMDGREAFVSEIDPKMLHYLVTNRPDRTICVRYADDGTSKAINAREIDPDSILKAVT